MLESGKKPGFLLKVKNRTMDFNIPAGIITNPCRLRWEKGWRALMSGF